MKLMKLKYSSIIILIIMIASSCRKEIPFDAEATEPKIVVNSLFSTDEAWTAHIGRSAGILDTADYSSIPDATVFVYDASNNQVAALTHTENGIYVDTLSNPSENQEYRIEVSVPGFRTVTGVNSIPTSVPILSIDTISATNSDGVTILQIDIVIDDPAGINNYYMVEMRVLGEYYTMVKDEDGEIIDSVLVEFNSRLEISSNDPNIETGNTFSFEGFENVYSYFLLSDENFDGQNYTLSYSVLNWQEYKDVDLLGEIRLLNTSEEFYNYRVSHQLYENAHGNPFATPVQVYSNIENGIGIFAGGTLTVWEVDF